MITDTEFQSELTNSIQLILNFDSNPYFPQFRKWVVLIQRVLRFRQPKQPRLLRRQRALHLLVAGEQQLRRQSRWRRDIQVEIPMAMADGMCRTHSFRRSHRNPTIALTIPEGGRAAFVVAALVSTQGLPSGKRLMTNITDMSPSTRGRRGGTRRGTGDRRGLVVDRSRFPVASFVATESLVRGKDLVTKWTVIGRLDGSHRLGWRGRGAAAGKHDETESKILFFRGSAVERWAGGTLALDPGLERLVEGRGGGHGRGIESFERHRWRKGSNWGVSEELKNWEFEERERGRRRDL